MLTEFIFRWNPLNFFYGIEVELEDLICHPLQPTETLREDFRGCCRRIKAPSQHSSQLERFVFNLQISLNHKGHIDAIEKIISLFHKKLLQNPPQFTEKLQEFNLEAEKLLSLRNDYCFVFLRVGDSAFVESRLNEIKKQAYSFFSQFHEKRALEEEKVRKNAFILFQETVEQQFEELNVSHLRGLTKMRLLSLAFAEGLRALFEERILSLKKRFKTIKEIQQRVIEMENEQRGKFTIPYSKDYFERLWSKVHHEVRKIRIEAESMIGNLIINYHIAPNKKEVEMLLCAIEVDPKKMRVNDISPFFLDDEMIQIEKFFNRMDKWMGVREEKKE